jgi:hypothetical protein
VGKYEAILNFVGLGGKVPNIAARSLLELLETRHLLVHRSGIVDSKFSHRCPWRNAIVDSKLPLDRADFGVAIMAAMWYLTDMQCRANRLFPECQFNRDSSFTDQVLDDLKKFNERRDARRSPETTAGVATLRGSEGLLPTPEQT